jgi:hypothetical protein
VAAKDSNRGHGPLLQCKRTITSKLFTFLIPSHFKGEGYREELDALAALVLR